MKVREMHITWQEPPSVSPNRHAVIEVYYAENEKLRCAETIRASERDLGRMTKRLRRKHNFCAIDKVREYATLDRDFSEKALRDAKGETS